ncbi:hypothetical protein PUR71_33205 [Streptomyces sp. SP17BM10]|uniref:hypothetical protein n=1 Tax=Streptomyces sp. SP17BM10 TaxID=3002530 RepID=UPI002E78A261|nr:hypothetical protein [Streptomyces sp. SP17BM10]MEE1787730.1 hypothetical protein [Streptomyces sp. SP17BM10]
MTTTRAARFAAAYALFRAAGDVADHWIQTDHQAATKGHHDHAHGQSSAAGRRACAAHVATYTATQAAALIAGSRLLGLRLRPAPVAAALALSAVTHYVADRQGGHWRDDQPRGVVRLAIVSRGWLQRDPQSGYLLDQAWHHAFETTAALIASA